MATEKGNEMFAKEMTKAAAMSLVCVSSDSGLPVKQCWCADCKDIRSRLRLVKAAEMVTIITA